MINGLEAPDLSAQDAEVAASNKKIEERVWAGFYGGAAGSIIIALGIYFYMRGKGEGIAGKDYPFLKDTFKKGFIAFLGVVVAEFLFALAVPFSTEPLDGNKVRNTIATQMIARGDDYVAP